MSRSKLVERAITFSGPQRVPIVFWNRDQTEGDVMVYHLSLASPNDPSTSEWGYRLERLDDGTMGHPTTAPLPDWGAADHFAAPALRENERFEALPEFFEQSADRYRLASLDLSGFTVYMLLRGFENSMADFLLEPQRAGQLLDMVFDFECQVMALAARNGFHGIHFADDWGTQSGLMVSPSLWREMFKPRYRRQFAFARQLGLHVWFHCCGNFAEIMGDFHEIGVDVLNISQPNVVDIAAVSPRLRGKQCFLIPISYQTVSIHGTPDEIYCEAQRLYDLLATPEGGFIGYVEEYGCMGMSAENYRACAQAFRQLTCQGSQTEAQPPTPR